MSARNFQFLREQRQAYKSVRHAAEAFKKKVHTFQNPHATPFPDAVTYGKCCPRGCCISRNSPREQRFLADLLAVFNDIAASFGTPAAKLAEQDLILGVVLYKNRGSAPDGIFYVSFPAASMRAGLHPATQTFVKWLPTREETLLEACVGLHLKLAFDPFVPPGRALRAPLNVQTAGPVVHFTEHELVTYISDYFNGQAVDQVEFRRVAYKDQQHYVL